MVEHIYGDELEASIAGDAHTKSTGVPICFSSLMLN